MTLGLLLTAFSFGLRHGIDWDHIAAIADLSSTSESRRRGFVLSLLYALGHAVVVFGLGVLAILVGVAIPDSVDAWMGRIVGLTLVALGVWILAEIVRKGRNFRLQSRWVLILNGTFAGLRRVRGRRSDRVVAVEHSHEHEHVDPDHVSAQAHDHAHLAVEVEAPVPVLAGETGWSRFTHAFSRPHTHNHSHRHQHELALPRTANAGYGSGTAAGIGMLHGVGIESPTQIAIFVASTSVAGTGVGLALLGAWVAGLIIANSGLALLAGFGVLHAERNFGLYVGLAVVVAVLSIVMGLTFVFDINLFPEISF